jgi:hypothetical protein
VVASDVAYDPQLTQAFFVCLRLLLLAAPPHAIALVTLERRVNFSASMCDVVALDADVFADVSSLLLPPPLTRHPPPLTRWHSTPLAAAATNRVSCSTAFLAARCMHAHSP